MDGLEELEALANGNIVESKEAPPPATGGSKAGFGVSPKAAALDSLPQAWREELISAAAGMGIKGDDDLGWLLVSSFINAWAGAAAAGKSAEAVSHGVDKIPDQIYQGAIRAGDEIRGQLGQEMKERTIDAGRLLVAAIDRASNQSASRIKEAAGVFEKNFDKAVEKKTDQGVDLFARAAAQAAGQAARSASASRFFWSLSGVAFLIALFALIGAGGCWEYLSLAHRITPTQIALLQNGKLDCGQVEISGQQTRVCALQQD